MTDLQLEDQRWELDDERILETAAIFTGLCEGEVRKSQLCRIEGAQDWQAVGQHFVLVGHYGILGELGEGAFGMVYLAFDARQKELGKTARLVALKKPTATLLDRFTVDFIPDAAHAPALEVELESGRTRARLAGPAPVTDFDLKQARQAARSSIGQLFSQEATQTARLSACENVVAVLNHDVCVPYLALEYCDGGSLRQRMRHPYALSDVLRWGQELCAALEAAHELRPDRLIHCDLKPDNLLLHEGRLKVSDFGSSKMIQASRSLRSLSMGFTPVYAAPEAFEGKAAPASDIWSLGVMLYELLAGRRPFHGENILDLARVVTSSEAEPLAGISREAAPGELFDLVHACLARDPSKRPEAAECGSCLARCVEAETQQDRSIASAADERGEQLGEGSAVIAKVSAGANRGAQVETRAASWFSRRSVQAFFVFVLLFGGSKLFRAVVKPWAERGVPGISIGQASSFVGPKILATRKAWNEASHEQQDAAIDYVARKLGMAYERVETREYECGGQRHRIASFSHRKSGVELNLIPWGRRTVQIGVTTPWPFLIGRYELKQEEWDKIGGRDIRSWRGTDLPIETVSWNDAQAWLNKAGDGLRLPSEAEWEYACRAGTTTEYCFGDDETKLGQYGWYQGNSDSRTHPVGQKAPNAFGLYDIHGNVYEWCEDAWIDEDKEVSFAQLSRIQAPRAFMRVLRGGSWFFNVSDARSAFRRKSEPDYRRSYLGLRVCRGID